MPSILLTAGCASIGENTNPFTFAFVNRRQQQYHAEFTVWGDDTILIDGDVDIAARPPEEEEYTVLNFDNLARVTNGDTIRVQIQIAGETFEETYEVTCNQSENAENNFFFQIRQPGASTTSETGMEFVGSEC